MANTPSPASTPVRVLVLILGIAVGVLGRAVFATSAEKDAPSDSSTALETDRTIEEWVTVAGERLDLELPAKTAEILVRVIDDEGSPLPEIEVTCRPTGHRWHTRKPSGERPNDPALRLLKRLRAQLRTRAQTERTHTDSEGHARFAVTNEWELSVSVNSIGWENASAQLGPGGEATLQLSQVPVATIDLVHEDGSIPAKAYLGFSGGQFSSGPIIWKVWRPDSRQFNISSSTMVLKARDGEGALGDFGSLDKVPDFEEPVTIVLRQSPQRTLTRVTTTLEPHENDQKCQFALVPRRAGETAEEIFQRLSSEFHLWETCARSLQVHPGTYWVVAKRHTPHMFLDRSLDDYAIQRVEVGEAPLSIPVILPPIDESRRMRVLVLDHAGTPVSAGLQLMTLNRGGQVEIWRRIQLADLLEDGTHILSLTPIDEDDSAEPANLFLDVKFNGWHHRLPIAGFAGQSITVELPTPSTVVLELEGEDCADFSGIFKPKTPWGAPVSVSFTDSGHAIAILDPGSYQLELNQSQGQQPTIKETVDLVSGVQRLRFAVD